MTEHPATPPEGKLIRSALAAQGISQREAARRAGISETRWRQIVSGYQAVGGEKATFRSPDDTLARMAFVVAVSPDALQGAGRPEAAKALRELVAEQEAEAGPLPPSSRVRVDERWHVLEAVLRAARADLSPAEDGVLVGRVNVFFSHSPRWRPATPALPARRSSARASRADPSDEPPAPSAARPDPNAGPPAAADRPQS